MSLGVGIVLIFGIMLTTVAKESDSESESSESGLGIELQKLEASKERRAVDVNYPQSNTLTKKDRVSNSRKKFYDDRNIDHRVLIYSTDTTSPKQIYVQGFDRELKSPASNDIKKFRSKKMYNSTKAEKLQDKGVYKLQYNLTAKSIIDQSTTLRQLSLEQINQANIKKEKSKHQQAKTQSHTYSDRFRLNDKMEKSRSRNHFYETTDAPNTVEQRYNQENVVSKYDSPVNTDHIKFRSKDMKSSSRSKLSSKITTLKQVYLGSIEYNPDMIRNINDMKRKINTLIASSSSYKGHDPRNIQHLDNGIYESRSPREIEVGIMDLKYEPRAFSTESINKHKVINDIRSNQDSKDVANISSRRKASNSNRFSKQHSNHNIFIDVNPKFLKQNHFKHVFTTASAKTKLNIHTMPIKKHSLEMALDTNKTKKKVLTETHDFTLSKNPHEKPTIMEIKEGLNMNTGVNPVNIQKSRDAFKNKRTKYKENNKKVTRYSQVYNKLPRRRMPVNLNIKFNHSAKGAPRGPPTSNQRKYDPTNYNNSGESLSIEECKRSYRRMETPSDSLLNNAAVLTKIEQLENELKVIRRKLLSGTEIIETLHNKIYETEKNLKEFCSQEFKIVRTNKNMMNDDDNQSSKSAEDRQKYENKNTRDFYFNPNVENSDKILIARSQINQDKTELNKQLQANDYITTKPPHQDILNATFNNQSDIAESKMDEAVKAHNMKMITSIRNTTATIDYFTESSPTETTSINHLSFNNNEYIKFETNSRNSKAEFIQLTKDANNFTLKNTKFVALQDVNQYSKTGENDFEKVTVNNAFSSVQNVQTHKINTTNPKSFTNTTSTYSVTSEENYVEIIDDYSNENGHYDDTTPKDQIRSPKPEVKVKNNF